MLVFCTYRFYFLLCFHNNVNGVNRVWNTRYDPHNKFEKQIGVFFWKDDLLFWLRRQGLCLKMH